MQEPSKDSAASPSSGAGETLESSHVARPQHEDADHIGPYRILEKIGEGGMGVVYKAEQREPVRRIVALKVIKLGMDTREVVARFEAERQALALMSHPNVAKVFEAGVTESGRPYFAMEFVPGVPLTEYCDENKLDHPPAPRAVSFRCAMPSSTPTRRASFTAISSRRTSWSRCSTASQFPRSSTSASPRPPTRR